jgi:cob(I)alamin adenosyltransferase
MDANRRSITTKVGDRGTTFLFSGEEVPKNSSRTSAYGDLDELVSLLGIARAASQRPEIREQLIELQRDLFIVGTELATSAAQLPMLKERADAAFLQRLERKRDAAEDAVRMPAGFILPGGTVAAAHLDLARAVSRRLERRIVGLVQEREIENKTIVVWINRVSDYLWLLARIEEGDATLLK